MQDHDFATTKATPATNKDSEVGFVLAGKEVFGGHLDHGLLGAQTVSSAAFDRLQQRRNSLTGLTAGTGPSSWSF
jgi:hypothetical protein